MPVPRPLYRLPELAAARRVYICEGEKSADAARGIGLIATTSANGSKSAGKTDWTPLAGKELFILPDNDAAGRRYADEIVKIARRLKPPATVKIVILPDLPAGGDIVEWIASHPDRTAEQHRSELQKMAECAPFVEATGPSHGFEEFRPFPVHAMPEPTRGFIETCAESIGCAPSYVALPLLSAIGAAIGNTRELRVKRGWNVPPVIWTAVVGESGTAKTPAFKVVMRPLRKLQERALDDFALRQREYETERQIYEKSLAAWKRKGKSSDLPPTKPDPPEPARFVVSDTTVEALAPILLSNSRGVLLARDEISGWIGSFDRYSGGSGGADAAQWLSMFNAETVIVDRKTGTPKTIYVPRAAVSITGGIQPAILQRALSIEHRESGLAARLLLAFPPRRAKKWSDADIPAGVEREFADIVDRLYDLSSADGEDGKPCPVIVELDDDARALWVEFFDSHAKDQADLSGDLAAAFSKLEEYPLRLALVVHFIRWASNDPSLKNANTVDAKSMAAGITLAEWFKREARRVYRLFVNSKVPNDSDKLIKFLQRKNQPLTAREVQQGCRWLATTSDAEKALNELVKDGLGSWEPTPRGTRGQPTRRFVLFTVYENPQNHEEDGDSVDVDSVGTPENGEKQEWGEL